MKFNNLDNPYFILLLCIFAVLINTFSSVYFFPLLFLGVLFMAFFVCLKRRYYYSLAFVILTFLFIELNNGFKVFSVTLLAIFVYVFITPQIRRVMSFSTLNPYLYMLIFYFGIFILWVLNNSITSELNVILLINLIIDFLIFGVLI